MWIKTLMMLTILMMRLCVKALDKESTKENQFCWLTNSINDLDKIIKDKL